MKPHRFCHVNLLHHVWFNHKKLYKFARCRMIRSWVGTGPTRTKSVFLFARVLKPNATLFEVTFVMIDKSNPAERTENVVLR